MTEIKLNLTPGLAALLHDGTYKFSFVGMGQIAGNRFEFFKPDTEFKTPPPTELLEGFLGGSQMWCKAMADAILLMAYEEAEGFDTMLMTDNAVDVFDPDPEDMDVEIIVTGPQYVVVSQRPFPLDYCLDADGLVHIYDDEWMCLCGAGPTKEWDRNSKATTVCERCHAALEKQCHYPHTTETILWSVQQGEEEDD